MDYTLAIIFFTVAIFIYFQYAADLKGNYSVLDSMQTDSRYIADSLVSDGYPLNWTPETASKIGLGQKLNETKWKYFSQVNYNTSRNIFSTSFDYYVQVEDNNSTVSKPQVRRTHVLLILSVRD